MGEEINRLKLGNLGFKLIGLRTPPRLINLARAGFILSVDLESYYSDSLWRIARDNGWLEPVADLGSILSSTQVSKLAAGDVNPFNGLTEDDALRLKNHFTDDGKKKAARRVSNMTNLAAQKELDNFRELIEDLCRHFGFRPA
ncbi:hypothetical protein [Xanthobacter flavus]|uniref:hypothetical protein n=1 Tax=Xanthobacter flavus TaxID=281 RepID=UPI003727077B